MSLANEASYLYNLSKSIEAKNKDIKSQTSKAKKAQKKGDATKEMNKLKNLHKDKLKMMKKLKHHYVSFAHEFQKNQ
jgi:hypothetical protein